MDVVRRNIQALNGSIEVKSQRNVGSTFIIRLPLTLAILDGQLVKVCEETYIFPLVSIVESIQIHRSSLNHVTGSQYVMQLRDEYIPIVRLDQIFGLRDDKDVVDEMMLVVVEGRYEKSASWSMIFWASSRLLLRVLNRIIRKCPVFRAPQFWVMEPLL